MVTPINTVNTTILTKSTPSLCKYSLITTIFIICNIIAIIIGVSVGGSVSVGGGVIVITISFGFVLYYKKRSKLNSLHDILLKLFIGNNKKKDDSLLPNANNRPSVSYYMIHY